MSIVTIKILEEEIEEYVVLLDKVMALRTLKIIAQNKGNNDHYINERKIKADYIIAIENVSKWWDRICKKYSIPINGKKRNIYYQRNLITYEE